MALSIGAIAFGSVVAAAVVLFSIGTPNRRASPVAVAAPAPAAPLAALPRAAMRGLTALTSLSVELPESDRTFPGGSEAEAINNNCLACHSAGMVLQQPVLPRAVWQSAVDKMRNVYKAPIADADVPAIVNYLAGLKDRPLP